MENIPENKVDSVSDTVTDDGPHYQGFGDEKHSKAVDTFVHKENNVPNGLIKHDIVNEISPPGIHVDKVENTGDKNSIDDSPIKGKQEQDSQEVVDHQSTEQVTSADNVVCDSLERVNLSDDPGACCSKSIEEPRSSIHYVVYESEFQMPDIMRLITKDLSEPYSIYTYRYFIHNWPKLCFLAMDEEKCVGAIVCKLDIHKKMVRRGYIAMLAIDQNYRRRGMGSHLVMKAIKAMVADDCDEVVLETEITNKAALRLYENLGFVRDKRLFRYYLNGVDALRLKLWLR